jgi:hypothetical protein
METYILYKVFWWYGDEKEIFPPSPVSEEWKKANLTEVDVDAKSPMEAWEAVTNTSPGMSIIGLQGERFTFFKTISPTIPQIVGCVTDQWS